MVEAMYSAVTIIGDRTRTKFAADDLLAAAVERRIKNIGEAVNRLSVFWGAFCPAGHRRIG